MIFLNFFIGIFVLCLLIGEVRSDSFESNLKVSLSGAIFDDVSADDATIKVADVPTIDATLENKVSDEGFNELPEEAAFELNYLAESEISSSNLDPVENEEQLSEPEIRNDPTITEVEEVTAVSLDNFENDPPSSPAEGQADERDGAYQSLATAYQQITTDTEVIRTDLEDARNRLIAYLEADILRVAKDEMKEAEFRELIAKYEESVDMNASLRTQINDLSLQVEGITPVESVNDQEFKIMQVEHQKLKIFHDDLTRENEELRSELAQYRDRVAVPADMQEIAAQNEELSSQLAASKEVILSLTASLDSAEEASKSLATKLAISKNIVTVEQLSTENAKLELDVVTRESNARINKLEKELKVSARQLKVKSLVGSETSVPGDSESTASQWVTLLSEAVEPYTSTLMTFGGAGLVGVLAFQKGVMEKMQTPVTEVFKGFPTSYDGVIGCLGPYVSAVFAGAADVVEVIDSYYNDTLSPLFHDTILPEMSKMKFKVTKFTSARWSEFKDLYSVNIHAPVSALYEAHLAAHVNTVTGNIKELYDNNLKEFVDQHIAPRWMEVLASAGVLIAALNLPQVPGIVVTTVKHYYSASVTFLKENEIVRNMFGENTDFVVTFCAKCVTSFMVIILFQLVFTFVVSILTTSSKRRKSGGTHGEEKASIRFVRKGSQEHIDIKVEQEKDVTVKVGDSAPGKAAGNMKGKDVSPVACKIDGSLIGDKNSSQCLSPLREPRTSNLPSPTKNFKGPNSPYSGIPLSKTGR
jgi:hypothetical protein